MQILVPYLVAAATFIVADLIWLGYIAKNFYYREMGRLLADNFSIAPAVAFYLLYIAALVYFAVLPALRSGQWQEAIIPGAILGLTAYGTYDLTALAVVRDWPLRLSLVDMAWGTILSALSASVAAYVVTRSL